MLCCIPLWDGLGGAIASLRLCSYYTSKLLRQRENHTTRGFCSHITTVISAVFLQRSEAAPRGSLKGRVAPSCPKALFQSETKCEAIVKKMIFYSHANKIQFHQKVFALGLVLKVRVFGLENGLFELASRPFNTPSTDITQNCKKYGFTDQFIMLN